jgi:putative ABC transport system permease protein
MIVRLAFKELTGRLSFSVTFTLSIMIGLFTYLNVDNFKRAFDLSLAQASKELLTADLRISSRMEIPNETAQSVREAVKAGNWQLSEMRSFYSMVSASNETILVQVKAIDENYPLEGVLTAKDTRLPPGETFHKNNEAWVSEEVAQRLGVKSGERLNIGEESFMIAGIVGEDSSAGFNDFSLAPSLYISKAHLLATQLLKKGSVTWNSLYINLPENLDVNQVKAQLTDLIHDSAIRVNTHVEHSENRGRMLSYVTDYLWLMSLLCFFLAATCISYLFQNYLNSKRREIALFLSLGASHAKAMTIYIVKVATLGLLGSILAFLLMTLCLPWITSLFDSLSPVKIELTISTETWWIALLCGLAGPLLVCLPWIVRINQISASELFKYDDAGVPVAKSLLWYIPALVLFFGLATWKAKSVLVATYFFLGLFGTLLVFWGISALLRRWLKNSAVNKGFHFKHAAAYIQHNPVQTTIFIMALGLSSVLASVIPQLRQALLSELETPSGQRSDLFFFDLQEDQQEAFVQKIHEENLPLKLAPMIRARLTEVNGQDFTKMITQETYSREGEREQRSRNRGVNLSYEMGSFSSGEIVEGVSLSDLPNDGLMGVSIEKEYAGRIGVKIGDLLTFDVGGIPLKGRVLNLRKVKWTNFEPNFFILVDPVSLVDAPKTFVASIAGLRGERKLQLQRQLGREFPNVSMIDVSQVISEVIDLITRISYILEFMSILCLAVGLLVIMVILRNQLINRRTDFKSMILLGGRTKKIKSLLITELAILGGLVGFFSAIVGLLVSLTLTYTMFDSTDVDLVLPFLTFLIITTATILAATPVRLNKLMKTAETTL